MINQIGSFEENLERGRSAVKKSAKQGVQNFATTAKQQAIGSKSTPNDQGTNEPNQQAQNQMSDDQAKQFLQDLYGVKKPNAAQNADPSQNPQASKVSVKTAVGLSDPVSGQKVPTPGETIKTALGIPQVVENSPGQPAPNVLQTVKDAMGVPSLSNQKTPEEQAKIEALRNQLHGQYYQKLTDRPKQEERATEKLEREDQEEKMADLETEKKKPSKLPATQKVGTGETVVGVSG